LHLLEKKEREEKYIYIFANQFPPLYEGDPRDLDVLVFCGFPHLFILAYAPTRFWE
jgi:hypothetical protein